MALAQKERACGDAWIGIAAHPGEGVFMLQVIDPSVADEGDPSAAVRELDMYDRRTAGDPGPSRVTTTARGWRAIAPRSASASARIDAIARNALDGAERARRRAHDVDRAAAPGEWRYWRARASTPRC